MQTSSRRLVAAALLAVLASLACGPSGGSSSAASGAASGAGSPPLFGGIGTADAISPTEVVLSWPAAVNPTGAPNPGSMLYRIYRAFDPQTVQLESAFLHQTPAGVTSYADKGLPPFTTIYYRVVAVNTRGLRSNSSAVASARTPSTYMGGTMQYHVDVEPLWQTASPSGATCLSCHNGSAAGGRLNLSTYAGVMVGTGTQQAPNSFVVPYDGDATWSEFVLRFTANPVEHLQYLPVASSIRAFEPVLDAWTFEGALEEPDPLPPVFAFDLIENAGKYFAQWVDHDTVRVSFFHASDPESLPFSGRTTGQLEYQVFAGASSSTIDWLEPVATVMSPDKNTTPVITAEFDWAFDTVAIVVRALDASGRSVEVPPPGDPDYLTKLALRWRNQSVNEREIRLRR